MENKPDVLRNRFQIVSELSRGGMGAVYLANDLLRGCQVAVKKSFFSGKAQTRKGFELEAKLLARLDHPGLPKVIDYFISQGNVQTLVMDFVVGETLEDILASGKFRRGCGLDYEKVLDWALQILDILRYLHNFEPPIVHRDIKPNNIKLTAEDRIVLLDFGLAKGTSETIVGGMSGYSPIEQVHRSGTDPRSDIYALGTSIFHLLTDRYPYTALDRFREIYGATFLTETDSQSLADDPQTTVVEINPEVPLAISGIVAKAMSLMPKRRYQSAAEMKSAIIDARRELEYSQTRNSIQNTSVEIVKEWRKPKSLIDEDEPNLVPFVDDQEKATSDVDEKDPSKSLIPSGVGELSSEVFDAAMRIEESPRDSSPARFGAHPGFEKTRPSSSFNLRQTVASTDSTSRNDLVENDERPLPSKIRTRTIHLILGSVGLCFIISLTGLAWVLLSGANPSTEENIGSDLLGEAISVKSEANEGTSLQITKYGIDRNGKTFRVDENYRFAENEGFKFRVRSSRDGFLYIISRDSQGDVKLAYPERNQNNDLPKDSDRYFPLEKQFSFTANAPPEATAYFVLASSRENELVRRIQEVLADGKKTLNVLASEISELMNDLDKLAEDSKRNEMVAVRILKLQKR